METLYKLFLFLHIAAGFLALISGGISFLVRKGKGWHSKAGRIYFYSMLAVGSSALLLCVLKFNPFLFIVGGFSLYMTITGYRSLRLRRQLPEQANLGTDWLIWTGTLLSIGSFLVIGRSFNAGGLSLLLWVFCLILLGMLLGDARAFRTPEKWTKEQLLRKHISRMGGAYIATFTAFLVTNIQTDPIYIAWLLPTALGTPLIIYFQIKFSPKKKKKVST